jgi:hypothetical protein
MFPGWWYTYPSGKYEIVSWDDIPNKWKVIKVMFQTTKQFPIFFPNMFPPSFGHLSRRMPQAPAEVWTVAMFGLISTDITPAWSQNRCRFGLTPPWNVN